jgi:hypothetical protein
VRDQRAHEEQRVEEASGEVERLRARRDSLAHDSATIERVARERYGLIRDGERLYRFAETPDSGAAPTAAPSAGTSGSAVGPSAQPAQAPSRD